MRIILMATTLALSCSFAVAGQRESCESISKMAGAVMEARQSGMPITDLLKITSTWEGEQAELAESMAMIAYNRQLCASDSCKKSVAAEFENTWYLACMKK